ncbi:uncharacterized protein LOC142521457 isoform X2 [Primulina tabacum]|uniref:uncharacterized protein LOC142521457 isoform X2 n=1 Tax=Primulina tabacum TaxID=48773 RepID=UPI003F59C515
MASYLRQKWQSLQITSSGALEQEEEQGCGSSEQDEPSKIGVMRTLVQAQDPIVKEVVFSALDPVFWMSGRIFVAVETKFLGNVQFFQWPYIPESFSQNA